MEANISEREKKIKIAEKLIVDNIQPDCPLCDSDLEVSKKQEGDSGAFAYKYRCTNQDCDLHPYRTLHTPWYLALVKAFRNQIIGLLFTAAGSITLAGLVAHGAGLISFNGNKNSDSNTSKDNSKLPTQTAKIEVPIANPDENLPSENQENTASKNDNTSEDKLTPENKLALALFYSSRGLHQNLSLAQEYFLNVIDLSQADNATYDPPDNYKKEIILRLRERPFNFQIDDMEKIISYINQEGASLAENQHYHLAVFYNKLFTKTQKIYYKYKELESYIMQCQSNQVNDQIKEELNSVLSFLIGSQSLPDWTENDQNQIIAAINTPSASSTLPQYIQKLKPYLAQKTD